MGQIDELVSELVPDGVTYCALRDVATFRRGTSITKKVTSEGKIPVIAGGRMPAYLHGESNRSGETIAVAGSGAYAGFVTFWTDPVFVSDAFTVHPDPLILASKYVYHFLLAQQEAIHAKKSAGGVPHIKASDLALFRIPVPPLEIQREIVKVLDLFKKLEAELEAELEARRIQFGYYRDQLIRFPEGEVRQVLLGDMLEMRAGDSIPASEIAPAMSDGHCFPCYGGGGRRGFAGKWNREGDYVLIGRQGALCGNVTRARGRFFATEHSIAASVKKGADIAWTYHALEAMNLNQYASKSAQPGLNVGNILKLQVEIPSLEEQKKVGAILDKFDMLLNDLSIGLPAELAARGKQYEHYRDQLLTFEEKVG